MIPGGTRFHPSPSIKQSNYPLVFRDFRRRVDGRSSMSFIEDRAEFRRSLWNPLVLQPELR